MKEHSSSNIIKPIIFLALFLISLNVNAQNFGVINVDSENFPEIRAYVEARDIYGNAYTDLTISDFSVLENGISMDAQLDFDCDRIDFFPPISVVLALDVSTSMHTDVGGGERRVDWVMYGARAFVDSIKLEPPSAVGILTFAGNVKRNSGFHLEKDSLNNFLDRIIIEPGATDFNWPFLAPNGGIEMLKTRPKNIRRVMIFLTDGEPERKFYPENVIPRAQVENIQVFNIFISTDINPDLDWIANETGGKSFRVNSKQEIKRIFEQIVGEIQSKNQCWLSWNAPYGCDEASRHRYLDVTFKRLSRTVETEYTAPESSISKIEPDRNNFLFGKIGEGITQQQLELTAKGADFNVTGYTITPDLGDFSIDWEGETLPFVIPSGQKKTISINYINATPDSSLEYTLKLETGPCPSEDISLIAPCGGEFIDTVRFEDIAVGTTDERFIECIFRNTTAAEITGFVQLDGSDKDQYQIVEGGGDFTLGPGECHDVRISFTPDADGDKEAYISFNIPKDCGDPGTYLLGNGIVTDIPVPSISWGDRRLLTDNDSLFVLVNSGSVDIEIVTMTLSDNNNDNFTVTLPSTPVIIPSGGNLEVPVSFTPQTEGYHENYIDIELKDGKDILSGKLSGFGILPKITTLDINFPATEVGKTSNSIDMVVTNPSTTADLSVQSISFLGVSDDVAFQGSPDLQDIIIPKDNGEYKLPVVFAPQSPGSKEARIIIISDAAPGENPVSYDTVTVRGDGYSKDLVISPGSLDFGDVLTCNSPTKAITIDNTNGTTDLEIEKIYLKGSGAGSFSYSFSQSIIIAGRTADIEVTFRPADIDEYRDTLVLETSNGNAGVFLSGNGTKTSFKPEFTRVIEPDISIGNNTLVTIPGLNHKLEFLSAIPDLEGASVSEIKIVLEYDPSKLQYQEGSIVNPSMSDWSWDVTQPQSGKIEIAGNGSEVETPFNLTHTVDFKTFLSDDQFTDLGLSVEFQNGLDCIIPEESVLTFDLRTCYTQGRLITINPGYFSLKQPSPNPAAEDVEINFSLGFESRAKIELVNTLGNIVKVIIDKELNHGSLKLILPVGNIPNGLYFLRMTAGQFKDTKQIIISK